MRLPHRSPLVYYLSFLSIYLGISKRGKGGSRRQISFSVLSTYNHFLPVCTYSQAHCTEQRAWCLVCRCRMPPEVSVRSGSVLPLTDTATFPLRLFLDGWIYSSTVHFPARAPQKFGVVAFVLFLCSSSSSSFLSSRIFYYRALY